MEKVLVVCGPTASGKSALAMAMAQSLGGEIVSADSMQIYKHMDIGTAKPTLAEQQLVPHHMIDIVEPNQPYSVSRYGEQAYACVLDIQSRGKLPIVCGGTGLYINALVRGTAFLGADTAGLRDRISAQYDALGGQAMHSKLQDIDRESYEKLHPNDKKRIVRALEVYEAFGITISKHNEETRCKAPRLDSIMLYLDHTEREFLYHRIDMRVDQMMNQGLEQEVKNLYQQGFLSGTAGQAIGYKELLGSLTQSIPLEQSVDLLKQKSRNYAKRQITWFKAQESLHRLNIHNDTKFDDVYQNATEIFSNLR